MGLDMYAYAGSADEVGQAQVDFKAAEHREELCYWRKHPDLHGFMEQLYREKGGKEEMFNCVNVRLDDHDLSRLYEVILSKKLPKTVGFFFGDSGWQDWTDHDLAFIEQARAAIRRGKVVYYTSWW